MLADASLNATSLAIPASALFAVRRVAATIICTLGWLSGCAMHHAVRIETVRLMEFSDHPEFARYERWDQRGNSFAQVIVTSTSDLLQAARDENAELHSDISTCKGSGFDRSGRLYNFSTVRILPTAAAPSPTTSRGPYAYALHFALTSKIGDRPRVYDLIQQPDDVCIDLYLARIIHPKWGTERRM